MTFVVSCVVNWKKSQYPKIETRRLVIFLLSSLYILHQMVPLTKHANHRTKCQKKWNFTNSIILIFSFFFSTGGSWMQRFSLNRRATQRNVVIGTAIKISWKCQIISVMFRQSVASQTWWRHKNLLERKCWGQVDLWAKSQ